MKMASWIRETWDRYKPRSVSEDALQAENSNVGERMASHLKEYMDYYKTCEEPGYAVLVTGEWGVGKSFQVKGEEEPQRQGA